MTDAKYVAEKLECFRKSRTPELCVNIKCEYNNRDTVSGWNNCKNQLLKDAIELLNRKPVKPVESTFRGKTLWACGECQQVITYLDEYCCKCGVPVDWSK